MCLKKKEEGNRGEKRKELNAGTKNSRLYASLGTCMTRNLFVELLQESGCNVQGQPTFSMCLLGDNAEDRSC